MQNGYQPRITPLTARAVLVLDVNVDRQTLSTAGICMNGRGLARSTTLVRPIVLPPLFLLEPRHEKTNVLHMQKQRRRSASR